MVQDKFISFTHLVAQHTKSSFFFVFVHSFQLKFYSYIFFFYLSNPKDKSHL